MNRFHDRERNRRGVAAMEFVVVLPLLATAVLGCIDFGRFAHVYIAVTNSARAGAGFGGDHPYTTATQSLWQKSVQQAVVDELSQLQDYDNTKLTVTVSSPSSSQVQVQIRYQFTTLVNWPGIPNTLTLQRVVVMPVVRP
jgi:Flp pilus assembly protein TadG